MVAIGGGCDFFSCRDLARTSHLTPLSAAPEQVLGWALAPYHVSFDLGGPSVNWANWLSLGPGILIKNLY